MNYQPSSYQLLIQILDSLVEPTNFVDKPEPIGGKLRPGQLQEQDEEEEGSNLVTSSEKGANDVTELEEDEKQGDNHGWKTIPLHLPRVFWKPFFGPCVQLHPPPPQVHLVANSPPPQHESTFCSWIKIFHE